MSVALARPRSWVILLAALFAVAQLANTTGRDTPDSENYLSYALSLRGESKPQAAAATIDYVCAGKASLARRDQSVNTVHFHAPSPTRQVTGDCRREQWELVSGRLAAGQPSGHMVPFMSARLLRIFEARPGYPALLVPFITLLGVKWGLWASGVVITVAGGVFAFLVLRTLRASTRAALTGQALFYVLPCGTTAMRPMTEGLMLTLTLAALWGCVLALHGRPRAGATLVVGCLLWLFTVKHPQALFLGLCLAGACAVIALWRRRRGRAPGRGVLLVGAVAGCGAVLTMLVAKALHYPTETESLQDLLTDHFARPDRIHPWPEFLGLEVNFWVEWLRRQLLDPLFLTALVAAAWGALRQRPAFGVLLLGAAGTGILTQAAHPNINIWGDRLIVLAWLLPVLGLPLLLEGVVRPRARALGTVPGPLRRETTVAR